MVSIVFQAFSRQAVAHARRHSLWLNIGVLLVSVIALVLFLISFLNYSNYRKAFLELNSTRYLVVAKDVRQTIVAGLNIGLAPSDDLHLLAALKEMTARHDGIRYIGILDETGHLAGGGRPSAQTGAAWMARLASTRADSYWSAESADTFQVGLPFVNNFGLVAGAVVIDYERAPIEAAVGAMLRKLWLDVMLTLFLLACLTFAGVYLLTRKFSRQLAVVGAAIDATLAPQAPPVLAEDLLDAAVARDINIFTAASHRLARDLAELEQYLDDGQAGQPARVQP